MQIIREPWDTYNSLRREHTTAHSLAVFRRCPYEFHLEQTGELTRPDSPAFAFGRAVHTMVLEGAAKLQSEYAIGAPINPKTQKPYGMDTKAYGEWAAAQGKPAISPDQLELLTAMAASVENHAGACALLSEGEPELTLRGHYCSVPCQGRLDWRSMDIVDLKTCDDLDRFERDIHTFEYVYQLAFYEALVSAAGEAVRDVFIIAVEKRKPNRCGVWHVTRASLDFAREKNEAALERLRRCAETGVWPTGFEHSREV